MLIRALDSARKGRILANQILQQFLWEMQCTFTWELPGLEDAKYLFQLWDNTAFSSRKQLNETESSQPQMKPKPTAVNGSIPIDLIGTKTQLAFLNRVRLIYIGWIWDKSTNITEIRIWLVNVSGVGLAVARESRAGFGLQDTSGSQPSAHSVPKSDNAFFTWSW